MMIIIILLAIWWYNNFTLCVSETEIRSKKINDEITVVHLSDLHGAVFGKGNSRLISKVEEQDPDVIFITGDMYTHGENGGVGTALDLMRELAKEFEEVHGTIVCREMLGLSVKHDVPVPEARTEGYYKRRPCAEIIGDAAEILEKFINEKNGG